MNNWDKYEGGLKFLGAFYLLTLFTNPVPAILDLSMILFFGWVIGVGIIVYSIEGGK